MPPEYRLRVDRDEIEIDLSDTDIALLDLMEEGRVTPRYAAGEIDKSRPHVTNRLKRLTEHEIVERVDRGLYELAQS